MPRFTLEYDLASATPLAPSSDFEFVSTAEFSCAQPAPDRLHDLVTGRNTLGVLLGSGDTLKFVTAPDTRVKDWVVWVDTSFNTRSTLDANVFAVRSDQPGTLDTTAPMGDGRAFWVRSDESVVYFGSGATLATTLNKWTSNGVFSVVRSDFKNHGPEPERSTHEAGDTAAVRPHCHHVRLDLQKESRYGRLASNHAATLGTIAATLVSRSRSLLMRACPARPRKPLQQPYP